MHILGTHEHARVFLELPVRRERHPEGGEIVGDGFAVKSHGAHLRQTPVRACKLFDHLVRITLAEGKGQSRRSAPFDAAAPPQGAMFTWA